MFLKCSSLKELDVSNFIINKDTYIIGMFEDCSNSLKEKVKSQNKALKDSAFEN